MEGLTRRWLFNGAPLWLSAPSHPPQHHPPLLSKSSSSDETPLKAAALFVTFCYLVPSVLGIHVSFVFFRVEFEFNRTLGVYFMKAYIQ